MFNSVGLLVPLAVVSTLVRVVGVNLRTSIHESLSCHMGPDVNGC